jgi:hypothetical protein
MAQQQLAVSTMGKKYHICWYCTCQNKQMSLSPPPVFAEYRNLQTHLFDTHREEFLTGYRERDVTALKTWAYHFAGASQVYFLEKIIDCLEGEESNVEFSHGRDFTSGAQNILRADKQQTWVNWSKERVMTVCAMCQNDVHTVQESYKFCAHDLHVMHADCIHNYLCVMLTRNGNVKDGTVINSYDKNSDGEITLPQWTPREGLGQCPTCAVVMPCADAVHLYSRLRFKALTSNPPGATYSHTVESVRPVDHIGLGDHALSMSPSVVFASDDDDDVKEGGVDFIYDHHDSGDDAEEDESPVVVEDSQHDPDFVANSEDEAECIRVGYKRTRSQEKREGKRPKKILPTPQEEVTRLVDETLEEDPEQKATWELVKAFGLDCRTHIRRAGNSDSQ